MSDLGLLRCIIQDLLVNLVLNFPIHMFAVLHNTNLYISTFTGDVLILKKFFLTHICLLQNYFCKTGEFVLVQEVKSLFCHSKKA